MTAAAQALHELTSLAAAARNARGTLSAAIIRTVQMPDRPPMTEIARAAGISRTELYRIVDPSYRSNQRFVGGTAADEST